MGRARSSAPSSPGGFSWCACLSRCYPPPDTAPHPLAVERPRSTESPASRALPPTANARRPATAVDATTRCAWEYSGPGFTRGFLKTDPMGHSQPAKDQKMAVTEPSPQWLKKSLYFFGQTRYLDHGWP